MIRPTSGVRRDRAWPSRTLSQLGAAAQQVARGGTRARPGRPRCHRDSTVTGEPAGGPPSRRSARRAAGRPASPPSVSSSFSTSTAPHRGHRSGRAIRPVSDRPRIDWSRWRAWGVPRAPGGHAGEPSSAWFRGRGLIWVRPSVINGSAATNCPARPYPPGSDAANRSVRGRLWTIEQAVCELCDADGKGACVPRGAGVRTRATAVSAQSAAYRGTRGQSSCVGFRCAVDLKSVLIAGS